MKRYTAESITELIKYEIKAMGGTTWNVCTIPTDSDADISEFIGSFDCDSEDMDDVIEAAKSEFGIDGVFEI